MPFELKLPKSLRQQRWKVKIREKERVEPPHVTVIKGAKCWRWGLREGRFLDKEPPAKQVDPEVVALIREKIEVLIHEWDKKYPHNKVGLRVMEIIRE